MVNVPPSINGFYISGTTKGFNIDGMNSKTALMGASNWLVLTESGSVIGCSKTALQQFTKLSYHHVVIDKTPKLQESQPENMFGVQKNIL